MHELCPDNVQHAHNVFSFLSFTFIIVFPVEIQIKMDLDLLVKHLYSL